MLKYWLLMKSDDQSLVLQCELRISGVKSTGLVPQTAMACIFMMII